MLIQCQVCDAETELDCGDLPRDACDDTDWECPYCCSTFMIGWYASAEIRKVVNGAPLDADGNWTGEPADEIAAPAANGE